MRILKYYIPIRDEFKIEMLAGPVLHVDTQRGVPCIWVKTRDGDDNFIIRTFQVIGTGQFFNDENLSYIGTFQQEDGYLIWHLFEKDAK